MSVSKRAIQYALLFLAGAGSVLALCAFYGKSLFVPTPSLTQSSSTLANACVPSESDEEDIFFISCGGIY